MTAACAAPLVAAVFAAPAGAQETEAVTLSAAVAGNDFAVSITNDTENEIKCQWNVTEADADNILVQVGPGAVQPGGPSVYDPVTLAEDGDYLVNWSCYRFDSPDRWGSEGGNVTAAPFAFTVGEPEPEPDTGSLDKLDEVDLGSLADVAKFLGSVAELDLGGLSGSVGIATGSIDSGSLAP